MSDFIKNNEYNKGLHEFIKICEKAVKDEKETSVLFCDLLTKFDRLVSHYEKLQDENLKKAMIISEFSVLKHNLSEIVESSQSLILKITPQYKWQKQM